MTKTKFYVFTWHELTDCNGCTYYRPLCGTDGIRPLDNRLRGYNRWAAARDTAKNVQRIKPHVCGFSVGTLTVHDPDNVCVQSDISFYHFDKGPIPIN